MRKAWLTAVWLVSWLAICFYFIAGFVSLVFKEIAESMISYLKGKENEE